MQRSDLKKFVSDSIITCNMHKKHWKDLFIGIAMIGLSVWLWFAGEYTLEIGIILGLLTLLWLVDR